jgi:hypothetical protein
MSRVQTLANYLSSPRAMALTFGFCATVSSVIAAYWEGRLFSVEYIKSSSGDVLTILPFDRNISTLLDFILLNPIVIYFLQRTRIQQLSVRKYLGLNNIPLYHRLGVLILSVVFGIYAMKFYVQGSQFYDATMVPNVKGEVTITVTGWIVYSWTALYIAGLIYAAIQHGAYVTCIVCLERRAIPYTPFHPDQAGGIRFMMDPSLSFGYAMSSLLLTFVVFIIQDRIYHIESNRLLGFVAYILIAAPLFGLPFYHLHRLMKERRDDYLFEALDHVTPISVAAKRLRDPKMLKEHVAAIENVDKYRKIVLSFPVWPMPMSLTLNPAGSILAAAFPLVEKLLSNAFPGLSILGQ